MYSRAQEISINWLSTWGAGGSVLELPTTRIHYSGMFQTNLRNDKNYSLEEKVWKEMDGKKKNRKGTGSYVKSSLIKDLDAAGM